MQRPTHLVALVLLVVAAAPPPAQSVGTAFTYQGQLQKSGDAASGPCDFQLSLWSAAGSGAPPAGGSQIGSTQTVSGAQVTDGLFTLQLDFGATAFSAGNDRWLQIAVRCPSGGGGYQTLAPRQPLTAAPFALFANAIGDGSVGTSKLAAGAVTTSQLATNAVTAAQIADGTISSSDLGAGAVSTAKIGDGQVTGAKLAVPLRLTSTAANSSIGAIDGTSTGLNGVGVSGTANNGAIAVGVAGSANTGTGVAGFSTSGYGVRGLSHDGVGVLGEGTFDAGVWGESNDVGVFGTSTGSGDGISGVAGTGAGVRGESTDGVGVVGEGFERGVQGTANSVLGTGVYGENNSMGYGVFGQGGGGGVGVGGFASAVGVYGVATSADGKGVVGRTASPDTSGAIGVEGTATSGVGVRGNSTSGYAGLFVGNVAVTGVLTAGFKQFKIDHPLDPANRYLAHSSVESSDMKNIYDGVAVLDANGEARVELPTWFEALNRDLRYQLTCIGGFAPVYVADEVRDAHFRIAGGTPGLKVSWQITGIRHDAFALAHPLVVEADKSAGERGRYLNPVEQGQPASLSVTDRDAR